MYKKMALKLKFLSAINQKKTDEIYNMSLDVFKGESVFFLSDSTRVNKLIIDVIVGNTGLDFGTVRIDGRAIALNKPKQVFNNRITGKKNIYFFCKKHGIDKNEVISQEEIVKFSELGNEIDEPVKKYSNEAKTKLAYAIGLNVNCSVLMIDESFFLNDSAFMGKVMKKIKAFLGQGGSTDDFCY